nr:MAG TPA: hypothetical protein [Caudoviricetes sp.]
MYRQGLVLFLFCCNFVRNKTLKIYKHEVTKVC